ncbi:(deoxy)nucleoside triphosphate pyrophosphohydrolase [Sphingobacterium spiritivorum]|uniref:(deoxy)nucleoside triphosphate pyrophosphohydrolase n=1 Tax=Sphingobacterium spiritivorum TaxID=258 RepID=UPI001F3A23D6|nr:(deoxy)nucleoside triphosphate pyrophosphohydrolase [Sphingobacterium spiritivorum]
MKLPLKWEFPGGKIESGESKKDCLIREIKEELHLHIEVNEPLKMVEHHYTDFSLQLFPFVCSVRSGQLTPQEHAQALWVSKQQLMDYDWAEADIPIVKEFLLSELI